MEDYSRLGGGDSRFQSKAAIWAYVLWAVGLGFGCGRLGYDNFALHGTDPTDGAVGDHPMSLHVDGGDQEPRPDGGEAADSGAPTDGSTGTDGGALSMDGGGLILDGGGSPGTCNNWGPFGTPVNLGTNVNTGNNDWSATVLEDGLTIYFEADGLIQFATRPSIGGAFGLRQAVTELDTGDSGEPSIRSDGLAIYYQRQNLGLYEALRGDVTATFGTPLRLTSLEDGTHVPVGPEISSDGLEIFYTIVAGSVGEQIMHARRSTPSGQFTIIEEVTELNTASDEGWTALSHDMLTLFFESNRPGGSGALDIWYATRPTRDSAFGSANLVSGSINTTTWDEGDPGTSPDGTELFFSSDRPGVGNYDMWVATRVCLD